VVVRCWGEGCCLINGRVSVLQDRTLEIDSDDVHVVNVFNSTVHLKLADMINFRSCIFYQNFF
jgi:hypothetical protein